MLVMAGATEVDSRRLRQWAQVAGKLAHGMKNPLATILGSIQLIELKPDDATVKEYAGYIRDEVTRLRRMADAFTRFTRLGPPVLKPQDVNGLVRSVLAGREGQLGDGIELQVRLARHLPPVMADPEALGTALNSVIDNALEAMTAKGIKDTGRGRHEPNRLTMRTRRIPSGATARIEVSDTGPGIPREYVDKAFEPFFVLNKELGAGLGLTLAKMIVEDHGGKIALQSSEGQGTTVTIDLPVGREPGMTGARD